MTTHKLSKGSRVGEYICWVWISNTSDLVARKMQQSTMRLQQCFDEMSVCERADYRFVQAFSGRHSKSVCDHVNYAYAN